MYTLVVCHGVRHWLGSAEAVSDERTTINSDKNKGCNFFWMINTPYHGHDLVKAPKTEYTTHRPMNNERQINYMKMPTSSIQLFISDIYGCPTVSQPPDS
ncbi:MAG: hypothetical protein LBU13_09520 [Synergistaceae bacterium]|jgi:hypothetical protein|nr:hypothetical protein [Synergistaceae bacterium]